MRLESRVIAGAFAGLLLTAVTSTIGACGDDSTTGTPNRGPYDSGLTLDSGTSPTEAGSSKDGSVDAAEPSDAGVDASTDADAQVQTNNGSWSTASGLPSAACTAWTLVDTATAHDPAIASGVMTLATDAVGENMYWLQGATDLITPPVIVVEGRLRLVSGSSTNASRAPATIVVRYGNPLRAAAFYVGSDVAFLNSGELTKGASTNVTTTDALHTYRLEIDTTTHAITVKRDAVSILTGTAYVETESGTTAVVLFGEGSILAKGTSEWASVTHNAHASSPCP
jgi:hypothetical protein